MQEEQNKQRSPTLHTGPAAGSAAGAFPPVHAVAAATIGNALEFYDYLT